MAQFSYGSYGFHQCIDDLAPELLCQPYHIGFGGSPTDRLHALSNAQRSEAEFLYHFTTRGVGIFRDDVRKTEHLVPAGSAFLIPIPSVTSYSNIPPQEWETMWIFFNGKLAHQFVHKLLALNQGNYIFTPHPDGPSTQALYKLFQLRRSNELHPAQASGIVYEILAGLFCANEEPLPPAIQAACRYINQEYDNPSLNVDRVATEVGLSRSHFSREFNRCMKTNPITYITKIRLQKATDLILGQQHKMKDIAALVGFPEPGYFNAVFKKTYGYPPGQINKASR